MTLAALSFIPFEVLVFFPSLSFPSSIIVTTLAVFFSLFLFRLSASTNICFS